MQTIEAKAILSAKDATGGVFGQISAKIAGMNRAAAMANRATAANAGMAARASQIASTANATIMGAAARVAGPAALAAGAVKAYKDYSEADLALRRIGITAEATDEQVAKLGGTLRDVAQKLAIPYEKMVSGFESLVAGGMSYDEAQANLMAIGKTAQASGAEVKDMSDSVLTLSQNLKVTPDEMPKALDAMAKAGKEGKFELKDMAQYFPSIGAQAAAVGVKGVEGVERISAAMQILRKDTGKSEEAATNLTNIFAKFQSEETVKKFEKMGVKDLRGDWKKAKAAGQDFFTFVHDEVAKATKGDMDKIPLLFTDMQAQAAVRSMMNHWDDYLQILGKVKNAHGTVDTDLKRITGTASAASTRLANSFNKAAVSMGAALDRAGVTDKLNAIADAMDKDKKLGDLLPESTPQSVKNAVNGMASPAFKEEQAIAKAVTATTIMKGEAKRAEETLARHREMYEQAQAKGFQIPAHRRAEDEKLAEKVIDGIAAEYVQKKPQALITDEEIAMWRKSADKDVTTIGKPGVQGNAMPPVQPLEAVVKAPVTADLTGSADVRGEVVVRVEPSSSLLSAVDTVVKLAGKLVANGPGSTGRSSPDAAPNSTLNTGMPQP